MPKIEVQDPSQESEQRGGMRYNTLTIELIGKTASGIDAARNLLADMTLAMSGVKAGLPDNVYSYLPGDSPELLPEEKNKEVTRVSMSYEIKYRE